MFPKIYFTYSKVYSKKYATLLGIGYSEKDYLEEIKVSNMYREFWDVNKETFESEFSTRLGVNYSNDIVRCYIVKYLPQNIPFSQPVTLNYLRDKKGQPKMKVWSMLHELIHFFEYDKYHLLKQTQKIRELLKQKYTDQTETTITHVVTSLIEESVMAATKDVNVSSNPNKRHYPEAYKLVESFVPRYEGGNVFEYLKGTLD